MKVATQKSIVFKKHREKICHNGIFWTNIHCCNKKFRFKNFRYIGLLDTIIKIKVGWNETS